MADRSDILLPPAQLTIPDDIPASSTISTCAIRNSGSPLTTERNLLLAAYDALRSYQYGNASEELAREMADAIGTYLSEGRK